jgi:hypothetical protein
MQADKGAAWLFWRLTTSLGRIAVTQPAEAVLDDGAEEVIRGDDEGLVISR